MPCPVAESDRAAERGAHQRKRRLPAHRAALLLPDAVEPGRRHADRASTADSAILGKLDIAANANNNISASWNFNHSRKTNETFDVATYGTSANGIEGDPARINVVNLNWFTTLSARMVNEAHFTYSRESRPRTAVASNLAADTGMGFGPTFRFGNPFFLQPTVDELIWRTQIKDNLSIVPGTTPSRSAASGCTR